VIDSIRPRKRGKVTVAVGSQTVAFSDNRDRDVRDRYLVKVSCLVRFWSVWSGVVWEIRTKLSRVSTKCVRHIRGKDCSKHCLLYPCCVARWAGLICLSQSEPRTLAASAADVGGAFLEARPSVFGI